MTEAEWLTATDPQPMLEFLRGKASDRKLRLFACACCRHIWHLLTDERSRRAVEAAESYADGQTSRAELALACAFADQAHFEAPTYANLRSLDAAPHAAEVDLSCSAADAAACVSDAIEIAAGRGSNAKNEELRNQATVFRCIFGNPMSPVAIDPALQTPEIVALAQSIYDDRAFDRIPLLSDALKEAGCTNADILAHCRSEKPHVRGCWVVDLILGKE